MTWTVTIQHLDQYTEEMLNLDTAHISWEHPEYSHDMLLAFEMAKRGGLKSATLTGTRAPNPYGGDEVVDISVRGMAAAPDFHAAMAEIVSEPGGNSLAVLHTEALASLENHPCPEPHDFVPLVEDFDLACATCKDYDEAKICNNCGVHLAHGLYHLAK